MSPHANRARRRGELPTEQSSYVQPFDVLLRMSAVLTFFSIFSDASVVKTNPLFSCSLHTNVSLSRKVSVTTRRGRICKTGSNCVTRESVLRRFCKDLMMIRGNISEQEELKKNGSVEDSKEELQKPLQDVGDGPGGLRRKFGL